MMSQKKETDRKLKREMKKEVVYGVSSRKKLL